MNPRSFYKLLIVSAFAFITATTVWMLTPKYSAGTFFGAPLLPGLIDQINDIEVVSIEHSEQTLTFLRDHNGVWTLMEENGYPANKERIRNVLIGLSHLEKIEQKTALPEFYPDLQVEDHTDKNAKSYLITLLNSEGKQITSLLVGKSISGITWNGQGYFVRFPKEAQSWLVRGNADVTGDRYSWISNKILPLTTGRIASLTLVNSAKNREISYSRETASAPLTVALLSDPYFSISRESIDKIEKNLLSFNFVHAFNRPADLAQKEPFLSALIETRDKLNIYLFIYLIDSTPYAAVAFSAAKDASENVAREASELEELHHKWLYSIAPRTIAALNPFLTIPEEKLQATAQTAPKVEGKKKEPEKKSVSKPVKKQQQKKKTASTKTEKNKTVSKPVNAAIQNNIPSKEENKTPKDNTAQNKANPQ